jgi:ABC-type Co2+ transport system permease subunit
MRILRPMLRNGSTLPPLVATRKKKIHYSRLTFVFLLSLVVLVTLQILIVVCSSVHFTLIAFPVFFLGWTGLEFLATLFFLQCWGREGGWYGGLTRTNIFTGVVPFSVHNSLSPGMIFVGWDLSPLRSLFQVP